MGRTGVQAAILAALLTGALRAETPPVQAAAPALQETVTEADLKAAFLFNFARFTEWPEGAFSGTGDEFRIGVLGPESALEPIQKKLSGKSVGKRTLKFVRGAVPGDLKACALIFVSDTEKSQIPALLAEFKEQPVLTVGETEGFAASGGVLNLYIEDKTVKYEINLDALSRTRLKATKLIVAAPKKVRDR
jgi:hypothetical protein